LVIVYWNLIFDYSNLIIFHINNKIKTYLKKPGFWIILVLLISLYPRLLIPAGIAFIIYLITKNMSEKKFVDVNLGKGKKILWALIILVIAVVLLINMIIVVPAGTTAVYHLFGKVRENELSSGIHLINPLARITKMSIRTEEYTMSIAQTEGKKAGNDSIDALTKEGLTVALDITVLYHLNEEKANEVYKNVGENYEEKIIRPQIRTSIREVIATYEAKDIYSEKRGEAQSKILENIKNSVEPRGITIESVLVRNVILPTKLADSIQEKLTAEQEAQRYDFVLQTEQKEAERKKVEAEGQKEAQRIITESLNDKYLHYLYIKELKDRQGTIYVPVSPDSGIPLFKEISE